MSYVVSVGFDEAHNRYYVLSSDIPGLHIETETFEDFVEAVRDATPELVGDEAAGSKIRFEAKSSFRFSGRQSLYRAEKIAHRCRLYLRASR